MTVLESAIEAAEAASPSLVVIRGEAGIGKSRLVYEGTQDFRGRNVTGSCVPLVGAALPYAPFIAALRRLGQEITGPAAPMLTGSVGGTAARAAPDVARGVLFDGVHQIIQAAAAKSPLLLVLEDLHWADPDSLDLLCFLVRQLLEERLLIVATIRVDADAGLRSHPVWAEIERHPRVQTLALGPLGSVDLATALAGPLASHADQAPVLLDRIVALSGGNPYFAEELANAPHVSALSPHLREISLSRVSALPRNAQNVIRLLAALGRPATYTLLARALPAMDVRTLDDAVEAAADAGVLVMFSTEGGCGFRHALTGAAVYEALMPGARRALHAAIASALDAEPLGDPAALSERAEHWGRSGDVSKEFEACLAAGRAALAVFAPAQARRHLDRALVLQSTSTVSTDAPDAGAAAVAALAAEAARQDGDLKRALTLISAAIETSESAPERAAARWERLGRYRYEDGQSQQAAAAYERGSDLLPPGRADALRAQLLAARASLHMLGGRHHKAVELAGEALEAATISGAERQRTYALMTRGASSAILGEQDAGLRDLATAWELAQAAEDVEGMLRVAASRCLAFDRLGQLTDALEAGTYALELARRHQLFSGLGALARANAADLLIALGRWREAEEVLAASLAGPAPASYRAHLLVALGQLQTCRGELDAAARTLREAGVLTDMGEPAVVVPLLVARAEVYLWRNAPDEAWPDLELATQIAADGDEQHLLAIVCALVVRTAADVRANQGRRSGSGNASAADRAAAAAARAEPLRRALAIGPQGHAALMVLDAELTRVRDRASPLLWALTATAWEGMSRPYDQAYALWRSTEAYLATGQRGQAATTASHAHELIKDLGPCILGPKLDALRQRARLPETGPRRNQRPPASDGPTTREHQVLELLAHGRSNREIARTLFISEKTVSVHVSNILAKLGAKSRGEAVALAHARGMLVTNNTDKKAGSP